MIQNQFEFSLNDCPQCGAKDSIKTEKIEKEIPHFGKVMQTIYRCKKCGLQRNNLTFLEDRPPMSYEYKVSSKEDLNARVVKSNTCTLELPELGVKIEPGPSSESFISNIEGVIRRIEDVVISLEKKSEGSEKEKAGQILEKIREIKEGRSTAQLILKDPYGNGAIPDEDAEKRKLTEDEIEDLKPR